MNTPQVYVRDIKNPITVKWLLSLIPHNHTSLSTKLAQIHPKGDPYYMVHMITCLKSSEATNQYPSPHTTNRLYGRKKASWVTTDVSYEFNCLQNCSQTSISLGFNVSHAVATFLVDGAHILDPYFTLEALLSCFSSFIQKKWLICNSS